MYRSCSGRGQGRQCVALTWSVPWPGASPRRSIPCSPRDRWCPLSEPSYIHTYMKKKKKITTTTTTSSSSSSYFSSSSCISCMVAPKAGRITTSPLPTASKFFGPLLPSMNFTSIACSLSFTYTHTYTYTHIHTNTEKYTYTHTKDLARASEIVGVQKNVMYMHTHTLCLECRIFIQK